MSLLIFVLGVLCIVGDVLLWVFETRDVSFDFRMTWLEIFSRGDGNVVIDGGISFGLLSFLLGLVGLVMLGDFYDEMKEY